MKPKISIVVPAYNCETYIADCLESIAGQTFDAYEVIVVNDGSSDRTEEIVRDFIKKDKRLRLLHQENAGPSAARNRGIRSASGKYIMFCDADDTLASHICEALYNEAERYAAQLAFAGHTIEILRNGKTISREDYYPLCCDTGALSGEELRAQVSRRFAYGIAHSICGKLYLRECLEQHAVLFDETIDIGEDLLFHLSYLPYVETCCWIEQCLYHYYYRAGSGSLATRFKKDTFCKKVRLYHETIRFFETYNTDDLERARHELNRRLFLEAKECIRGTAKRNASFQEAGKQVKEIVNDSTLQSALTDLNRGRGEELGFKNSLLRLMMQRQMANGLCLLFSLF